MVIKCRRMTGVQVVLELNSIGMNEWMNEVPLKNQGACWVWPFEEGKGKGEGDAPIEFDFLGVQIWSLFLSNIGNIEYFLIFFGGGPKKGKTKKRIR